MSVVTSDQSKLVLNAFAATFQNELLSADLVSWKMYDGEFDPTNRLQVSEQVGPRYRVTQTVDGVADLTTGVQGTTFGSEIFQVNRTFNTNMGWGDFAKVRDIQGARESEAIKNAATNMAEQIDAYIMGVIATASNNWVGTPANNVSTFNDVASGVTRLAEEGVAMSDLRAALTFADRQALGAAVVALPSTTDFSTGTYKNGFRSEVAGVPTLFTQQHAALTNGTRTTPAAVAGANQNVNYAAVAVSAAQGQYMTQTINLSGLGGTNTIVAGEVFTIAGVFAYDNRKQASLGRLQQFVVVTGATATAGAATIRIFPAIIVPGSGAGLNPNINTAHATVTAAPADLAAVTFINAASATTTPRFIIQKQAVVCNTVALAMPDSDTAMRRSLSKVPISVRMWKWSDPLTGQHSIRFDTALNANIRDRRRICRINGA
jgi:hypothetical protein